MGCIFSKPRVSNAGMIPGQLPQKQPQAQQPAGMVAQQPQQVQQQQQQLAPNSNARSTRARRLSYIAPGQMPAQPAIPQGNQQTQVPAAQSAYIPNNELVYTPQEATTAPGSISIKPQAENTEGALKFQVACISKAGREPGFKKTNQDNCFAFEHYNQGADSALFGAFDGHGPMGHHVSGYVKQHLPILLMQELAKGIDIKEALTNSFLEVNKALSRTNIDCNYSGSTAVVAYLKDHDLHIAWCGDSRAVMGKNEGSKLVSLDLTHDHKPTNPAEKQRILKANGRVEQISDETGTPMGPFRVWLQDAWIPGLAMSRAIGDVIAHLVGVSSEPEYLKLNVTKQEKMFVLASDGVWEFISSQEAVDILSRFNSAEEACKMLVEEAYNRWMTEEDGVVDDVTAVVVKLE